MGLEETSTFTYINGDAKIKTVFLKKKKQKQKRLQKLQLKGIHPEKNSLGSINKMLTSSSLWKFLDTVLEEEFFFFLTLIALMGEARNFTITEVLSYSRVLMLQLVVTHLIIIENKLKFEHLK